MAPEKASPEVVTRGRKNLDSLFFIKSELLTSRAKKKSPTEGEKKKKKPEGNCPPPSPTGLSAGTNKQEDECAQ